MRQNKPLLLICTYIPAECYLGQKNSVPIFIGVTVIEDSQPAENNNHVSRQ